MARCATLAVDVDYNVIINDVVCYQQPWRQRCQSLGTCCAREVKTVYQTQTVRLYE